MAYASLLSLTQTLEQILGSRDEIRVFHDKKKIKSLHEKLSFLLSFLEDSSYKNTESMTCLEERIRDAAYEAEDIIELHISKSAYLNYERRMESERHSLKRKLQKVIKEIDSISEEVEKMKAMNDIEGSSADGLMQIKDPLSGIEGIEQVVKTKDVGDMRATSSKSYSVNKDAMVGFEHDLLQIKERLVGQSSRLKIISIVGMGGIGKTTLARNIYNDSYIEHHFHIRAWTTISQEYRVQELLVHLLKSMGDLTDEMKRMETDELKTRIYQRLKGNRYLIVMDDVWDDKFLDELRRIFPDDNNGSRIILTTRLSNVAVHADSSCSIHHMSFLSPEESWNLLFQKALGNERCPSELEEIGKRIAEKCRGLPLALVVVGGVLYKAEKTRANWEYVAENVKSAVTGNDDDFMEILSWSYYRLPHRLRACFLYMGVFPEDYVIHVSRLIRLWVAEGFIKPIAHNSLEEVAKRYLEELTDRNLIMVRRRVYSGEIKTCSMHDVMRELCVKKAQEEKFLCIVNQEVEIPSKVMKNYRHLSIMKNHHRLSIHRPTFRSLLYFTGVTNMTNSLRFQLLRVLEASNINFNKFPIEIVKLVNLRYIALVGGRKFKIPASITKLCNLQTLIVFRSYDLQRLFLPPELSKLRHLLFYGGVLLHFHGLQNANLQTLSGVRDFRFTQEALQIIPNLKTLGTTYNCHTQTELSFYCFENLAHLHQLESFECRVLSNHRKNVPLPQNLAFPPNLKKLNLRGCGISSNNMLVIGSLPNLEVLKLIEVAFESNAWKTKEGEFSRLKLLRLEEIDFEFWEAEAAHFPILQCLRLRGCMKLKCIPSGIGEILTLQQIILYGCPPSVEISANSILQEQQDLGNDDLEVHVYPFPNLKRVKERFHQMRFFAEAYRKSIEGI